MKAIIIAAGMGIRLNPFTNNKPKCMLELNNKTLLQHQIEVLRDAGIDRIAIIKGYKKEMINYPDITYYVNDDFQNNNILHSLFYAEQEMDSEFIATYSDILYEKDIVKKLLANKEDISIVVDIDWLGRYKKRIGHPIEEAEKVILGAQGKVVKIGKDLPEKDSAEAEFIGMLKCSKKGATVFKRHFHKLFKSHKGKPFKGAPIFEKAYLTDMLQDLVDKGINVYCVTVGGGWREIDTAEDYNNALREMSVKKDIGADG